MDLIFCPQCSSNKTTSAKVIFPDQIIQICNICNIAFTYPPPTLPDYEQMDFHSSTKEIKNGKQTLTNINSLPADWRKLITIQSGLIEKYLPVNSRVLEIGCGEGLLLGELQKKNFRVSGIEPSHAAYHRALMRGIEAKNGYFPEQKFDGKFDGVIMSHVLEHIEKIADTIAEIKNIAPDGYLLLSQTNYRGLIPRMQKEKWYAWVPEQHFWHFTLQGLTQFLNKFGYRQVAYVYNSLVHPTDILYKIASLKENWKDQLTVLYKLDS